MLRKDFADKRVWYGCLMLLLIAVGLLSRRFSSIPLWVGDSLWAMMVYAGVRFLAPKWSVMRSFGLGLVMSYGVELSQLVQVDWLVSLRQTTLGHLVLGHGFLWSDLVAYSFGLILISFVDATLLEKEKI